MKLVTTTLALLAVAILATDASAEPPGKAVGKRGENRAQAGSGGGSGGQRDPSQIIARMMEEFDADQDSKLDLQELTALLQSLRDRRGQGRTGQGRTGQGRTGQGSPEQDAAGQGRLGGAGKGRPDGAGKGRRGSADGQASPGGEKPKRPAVQ